MDEKERYQARYQAEKERGVKFFPDIIYKDMIVAFAVFLLLVGLATFVGVPQEPPADPSDSSYIPRPEWYFLFLFQLLKYFPGSLEWIGTTVVPGAAVLILLLLPFLDRSPVRHWRKRLPALAAMGAVVLGMVVLTVLAVVSTPPQEEAAALTSISDQVIAGQDLYGVQCVECHGAEGEGGEIVGVEGLEGVIVPSLKAHDFIYTRTDETIFNIIEYGQPDHGMPPFGKAYGGALTRAEIQAIVTFMRYTWDDRVELPPAAAAAGAVPTLGPDEIPSYSAYIEPIIKRACLSCHRPGRKNNNFFMRTYQELMTSGDHAPNVIPGDPKSNLIRMLHREEVEAGGPMPPTKPLKDEWIAIWERWVLGGAPEFPVTPTPTRTPVPEATPAAPGATP